MDTTRLTHTTALILKTLKAGHSYGFDVMEITGLPSGTVYPALRRLENDGLVEAAWESEARAHREDRPARRYYKVTRAGALALTEAEKRYPLLAHLVPLKPVKA